MNKSRFRVPPRTNGTIGKRPGGQSPEAKDSIVNTGGCYDHRVVGSEIVSAATNSIIQEMPEVEDASFGTGLPAA